MVGGQFKWMAVTNWPSNDCLACKHQRQQVWEEDQLNDAVFGK
jgi:hypothetical protein